MATDLFKRTCILIATECGLTIGTNTNQVQTGFLADDSPDRCQAFIDSGGEAAFDLGNEGRMFYLQVMTQATEPLLARGDAWQLFEQLAGFDSKLNGKNLPVIVTGDMAWMVQSVLANAAPFYMGQDDRKRHVYSTNYQIRVAKI